MTPNRLTPEREKEIRHTHGCLISKEGREVPSCHEHSFCDCTVKLLLAEIDALQKQVAHLKDVSLLQYYSAICEKLRAERDALKAEADERNKWIRVQGEIVASLQDLRLPPVAEIKAENDRLKRVVTAADNLVNAIYPKDNFAYFPVSEDDDLGVKLVKRYYIAREELNK